MALKIGRIESSKINASSALAATTWRKMQSNVKKILIHIFYQFTTWNTTENEPSHCQLRMYVICDLVVIPKPILIICV